MDFKQNIFEVPIWGFILNNEKYHCSDYIQRILEIQSTEPSAKKSNFGGYQSRDNLHEEGIFQELVSSINKIVNDAVSSEIDHHIKINALWANVNSYKDCNGAHVHGGTISGVFYLQVPEKCGNLVLCNPAVRSDASPFKKRNYFIQPQHLACILFPSWLEHYVEPNLNPNVPRISLSFNLD